MRGISGYIKDYRQELESDIWSMPPLYHRVWQYLKYKVNHHINKVPMRDGTFITLKPGQHLTSVRKIANGVGYYERAQWKEPNAKTIKSILDWLVSQQMLVVESNSKYTLISLLNWEKYQFKSDEGNDRETVGEHSMDTNKNDKELFKNDKEDITTNGEFENFGESDGTLSPDPLRGDHQQVVVAEISHTPNRDDVDVLADRYSDLRTMRSDKPELPTAEEYTAMGELLRTIPLGKALEYLNQCFEDFDTRNKKSPNKKITSFKYCIKPIQDNYERFIALGNAREDAKDKQPFKGAPKKGNKYEAPMPKWAKGEQIVPEKPPEEVEKRAKELEVFLNNL